LILISDILKISDEDLDWLVPDASDVASQLAALTQGDKLIFVTRGAEGADAYVGTTKITYAAKPVEVVDTIGAEDTFDGAILHELARQNAFGETECNLPALSVVQAALNLAVASAALTVSRKGANPPWVAELV
jgi:fructokinase